MSQAGWPLLHQVRIDRRQQLGELLASLRGN